MKDRIQKVLANAGIAARRTIEEMVLQGRITVNGEVRTRLPILIDPAVDKIKVDDEPIKLAAREDGRAGPAGPRLYILMHKPKGVYSTNVAQGAQVRAIDLLPEELRDKGRVYPVGRLDAESKGLLLLTNDGDLTNRLTHPKFGVQKTYRAVVDGWVRPEVARDLSEGVWLADRHTGKGFKTARSMVKVVKRGERNSVLEITIREGRNRQVRRMLAQLGHKVRDLTRVSMGPITLHGLGLGKIRLLTPREVRELRSAATEKNRDGKPGEAQRDAGRHAKPILRKSVPSPASEVHPSRPDYPRHGGDTSISVKG